MTAATTPGTLPGFGDIENELASTRRILERFPDGKATWRPHDKSRTIGELASHVAGLPFLGNSILTSDSFTVGSRTPPQADTAAGLVELFDQTSAMLREAIANASPEGFGANWTLKSSGRGISLPRLAALRVVFVSHMIHHRAQLGVYYRLLGVPVPGLYGPTADEGF